MKPLSIKSIVASISLSCAVLICAAPLVRAQELHRIVIDVPFDFVVNGKTFTAGRYRVQKPMPDSENVLYISKQGSDEGTSFTTNTVSDSSGNKPAQLVFHQYGSAHFLSEVWSGTGTFGYRLPQSRAERIAARVNTAVDSTGTRTVVPTR